MSDERRDDVTLNQRALKDITRRHFFREAGFGLGTVALASLMNERLLAFTPEADQAVAKLAHTVGPHFAPKAKQVIYLFMAGAPSQVDLFDNKPLLQQYDGQEIPKGFIPEGERFAFVKGTPRLLGSPFTFTQHGQSGAEISELLPHLSQHADEIAVIRSMKTTQFNHAPAQIFMNTGHQIIGRPSLGSWLSYGLGSDNKDLPAFVVLISGQNNPDGGKSCWGSGFLPTLHQGVEFRSKGEPVLFSRNPDGVDAGLAARLAGSDPRSRHHRAPERRRPGDDDAHRGVRAGVPDADQRAGADRHPQRAAEDPRDVRHRAGPGLLRQQLPARATADRARRAIRAAVSPRLGHPRRLGRHRHRRARAAPLPRSRSGDWRAADGPEAARAARHDARRLGRRVRPDADQRGAQRIEAARPRPPSARVHDVDGRRRHRSPASPSDAPTISATTSSKIRWTCTTCTRRCCTCSGSTTRS